MLYVCNCPTSTVVDISNDIILCSTCLDNFVVSHTAHSFFLNILVNLKVHLVTDHM